VGIHFLPHETPPVLQEGVAFWPAQANALGFGGDRVDIDGSWTFQKTLGTGGWGHAGLWLKLDSLNRVLDRKVVKESYMQHAFNQQTYWVGEMARRTVKEEVMMRTLSALPNSGNIVRSEGSAVYDKLRMMMKKEWIFGVQEERA
jgi:hypothetical protein